MNRKPLWYGVERGRAYDEAGMDAWIDNELMGCEFPDARHGKRLRQLLKQLSSRVGSSTPWAYQDWANTKAAYRFFGNDRVSEANILAGQRVVRIAARQMAAFIALHQLTESAEPQPAPLRSPIVNRAAIAIVKHYKADDSIFIDDAYLVKGIAGHIFCKLVQCYTRNGRVDFTNKEIWLDSTLQLPDFKDNLEARLILLRRRLQDHCDFISLAPVGRGQFRLEVNRRLTLE